MFLHLSVSHSVHGGMGCLADTTEQTPPGRHPPGRHPHSPLGRHPPGRHTPRQTHPQADTSPPQVDTPQAPPLPSGQTPLRQTTPQTTPSPQQTPSRLTAPGQTPSPPADGYCSGRYVSYWNAFLCIHFYTITWTEKFTKWIKPCKSQVWKTIRAHSTDFVDNRQLTIHSSDIHFIALFVNYAHLPKHTAVLVPRVETATGSHRSGVLFGRPTRTCRWWIPPALCNPDRSSSGPGWPSRPIVGPSLPGRRTSVRAGRPRRGCTAAGFWNRDRHKWCYHLHWRRRTRVRTRILIPFP